MALAMTVLSTGQAASAAVVFQNVSFQFYTYAEAGGSDAAGQYQGNFQDLTGSGAAAALPSAPIEDEVHAQASFSDASGTLLSSSSAAGHSTITFASAGEFRIENVGTTTQLVTAAGGADPLVFAGGSPMYVYSLIYNFVLEEPTLLDFAYASPDTDYQTQFSLGGPTGYSDFITGTGSISQALSPGAYELYLFDTDYSGDVLQAPGTATDSITRSYALTLTPGVPEAATWGMMLAGVFLVGVALRRRGELTAQRP